MTVGSVETEFQREIRARSVPPRRCWRVWKVNRVHINWDRGAVRWDHVLRVADSAQPAEVGFPMSQVLEIMDRELWLVSKDNHVTTWMVEKVK